MVTMSTLKGEPIFSAHQGFPDVENEAPRASREAGEQRICIKCKGRIVFLDFDEIHWVEAAGNYLQLHTGGETYVVRDTMAEFGNRLEPYRFVRIHRSIIVNARYIRELKPWRTGEYVLTLTNGKELTLSRKYRSSVLQITAQGGCVKRIGAIRGLAGVPVKQQCERCSVRLAENAPAYACAHECTFCQVCTDAMNHVCPNCGEALLNRRSRCSPGRLHGGTHPKNGQ